MHSIAEVSFFSPTICPIWQKHTSTRLCAKFRQFILQLCFPTTNIYSANCDQTRKTHLISEEGNGFIKVRKGKKKSLFAELMCGREEEQGTQARNAARRLYLDTDTTSSAEVERGGILVRCRPVSSVWSCWRRSAKRLTLAADWTSLIASPQK